MPELTPENLAKRAEFTRLVVAEIEANREAERRAAHEGRPAADFVRQYRAQLTVEQLLEYFDPKTDYSLDAVAAELEALPPARESA